MPKYYYNKDACGSGKTHHQCREMVENPSLYIIAVDRRDMIWARERMLRQLAKEAGTTPFIKTICSQSDNHIQMDAETVSLPGSFNVRADIEALANTYSDGHVIVVATHAGLRSADLSKFHGWQLVIDETPTAIDMETISSGQCASFFKANYDLAPVSERSAIVTLRPGAATTAELRRDDIMRPLVKFHTRVSYSSTSVVTNLTDWTQMAEPNVAWSWWSIWSPEEFAAFDRVTILGSGFDRSVTYQLWSVLFPQIQWQKISTPARRIWAARSMTIHYFAQGHCASTALFTSSQGAAWLRRAAVEIASRVQGSEHIWSCNSRRGPNLAKLIPGLHLTPRQAGSNDYAGISKATMLYTAKPSPQEVKIFDTLGTHRTTVIEEREHSAIMQFMNRTSVRDPLSSAHLDLYVYDFDQANFLNRYFAAEAPHITIDLDLIDLGFANEIRWKKAGRPKLNLSPEQIAAAIVERRKKDAERKRKSRSNLRHPAVGNSDAS